MNIKIYERDKIILKNI